MKKRQKKNKIVNESGSLRGGMKLPGFFGWGRMGGEARAQIIYVGKIAVRRE